MRLYGEIGVIPGRGSPEIVSPNACTTGDMGWTERWKDESVEVERYTQATKDRRAEEVYVCACV